MPLNYLRKIYRQFQYKQICRSGLFDKRYYAKKYGITDKGIYHYMTTGWKSGYDPSPYFSTKKYLDANPDVKNAKMNPLLHYYLYGRKEGRSGGFKDFDPVLAQAIPQKSQPIRYARLQAKIRRSGLFDELWYSEQYGIKKKGALKHYLEMGWKKGNDPSPYFNSNEYLFYYPFARKSLASPLAHYICVGKSEGLYLGIHKKELIANSRYFDEQWYRKTYALPQGTDAAEHYMNTGWKLWYNPSPLFSGIRYYFEKYSFMHEERRGNPLLHYELTYNNNVSPFPEEPIEPGLTEQKLKKIKQIQDQRIKEQYSPHTKKLIVYLVPERDAVGGGVMSICSIAGVTKNIPETKDYSVMVATVPSRNTFLKYSKFKSEFDIFRFEQIRTYFTELEEIVFHIPEYFVVRFMMKTTPDEWAWMQKLPHVKINILNQNMDLMPRPAVVDILRQMIPTITMTCAHKQYSTRQLRTAYNMPVHYLSASNLVKYKYVPFEKKKNLLLYSPDEVDFKEPILKKIKTNFPKLVMKEVKDISYKDYLKLIGEAKWMITFGEGIDGYFLESQRSGTISFSVQNPTFFSDEFDNLENVYSSYSDMLLNIVDDMKTLSKASHYTALNDKIRAIDAAEYDEKAYQERIRAYYRNEYTHPLEPILKQRTSRLTAMPLISICMATYNGEKYLQEQLESIAALTYPNIELIISDDGSTDKTMQILRSYQAKHPCTILNNTQNHGLVGNFTNCVLHANGKYIALSDQDDIWNQDKLEVLLDRIDDFDIVYGRPFIIDENSDVHQASYIHDAYECDKTRLYHPIDFLTENPILGCATLMRADFVKGSLPIPKGFLYHDWWFSIYAICRGAGVCFVDIPVLKYRQHDTNTAKTFYESEKFSNKKLRTLQLIDRLFANNMKHYERRALRSEEYYVGLTEFSLKRFPAYVYEYYGANRQALTEENLDALRTTLNELLEGINHESDYH